jgi:predicted DNA-binding transcriptional regulator YafY
MAKVLFGRDHVNKHPHAKWLNSFIRSNRRGKDKDIHITYRKENGEESERKVRPLYAKKDVLVAHDHGKNAYRSFKLERIQKMTKTASFWSGFESARRGHD